jgi:hypothetical protein
MIFDTRIPVLHSRGRLAGMLGAYDSPAFTILRCGNLLTRYQRAGIRSFVYTRHGFLCVYFRATFLLLEWLFN